MDNTDVILDVDLKKRTDDEWSNIYHIFLVDGEIDTTPIDEFNWAYKLSKSKYYLKPSINAYTKELDYSVAEEMEVRAMKINRDLFSHADRAEKEMLYKGKYIQTKYVLDYKVK